MSPRTRALSKSYSLNEREICLLLFLLEKRKSEEKKTMNSIVKPGHREPASRNPLFSIKFDRFKPATDQGTNRIKLAGAYR